MLKSTVVPPVIDSSLTKSLSGSTAAALMSAMRFLGLITKDGKVLEPLSRLAKSYETDQWKVELGKIVTAAYAPIVGDLDLTTATSSMLEDCFKTNGKVTGQVLEKAVRFYLAALEQAGISVSPLLKARKVRSTTPRKTGKQQRKQAPDVIEDDEEFEDQTPPDGTEQLKLPLPGKGYVTFTVPSDLTSDDWKFLKPIFEMYLDRMLAAKEGV